MICQIYGYSKDETRICNITSSLLRNLRLSDRSQDYFSDAKFKFEWITVFRNENHFIAVCEHGAIFYTSENEKHLANIGPALNVLLNDIILIKDSKIFNLEFQAATLDYIKDINDVSRRYKDVRIDRKMIEEYNIRRDLKPDYKGQNAEIYTSRYFSNYFSETEPCYTKEVDFSTAEYYNDTIGRVCTTISVYYYNSSNTRLTNFNIPQLILKLEDEHFKILLNSFKKQYIEKIFYKGKV